MQPKFTQRNLWSFCAKTVSLLIVFALFSRVGFAQELPRAPHKINSLKTPEQRIAEEQKNAAADNDANLPNRKPFIKDINAPQAVCTTFTGQITAGDPTTSLRAFRDGVPKTCAAPGTCTAGLSGSFNYDQFTWSNPVNAVQCVTVTYTNTATQFSFVTAHNGSVVLSNLCTNWLGDPGSSAAAGGTIVWSFNAPALATIIFHVTNVTGGQTPSYSIAVDAPLCTPPAPCAGTPAPGNTISSVSAACPTTAVNLSLQNSTPGSGVTYAWERSTTSASGPWTAFGTSAPTQSPTQTQRTWYRCTVTCTVSGNSGTSTPVQVDQNPFTACYCISVAGSNSDEDIFNVTFGTLSQTSDCSTTAPGPGSIRNRYSNYTTQTPGTIVKGTLPISVQVGTCGGNFGSAVGVWVDMNQNGVFEHPAERVFLSNTQTGPHTASGLATIPSSALTGVTGMRVINVETGTPSSITPCGAYTWGETEDYLINIQPCVPITSVTGPTSVSAQCSQGANITNSVGSASFPTWQWEYRANSSQPWQFLNAGDLGGVVVSANSATLSLTAIPNSLNGYQVRSVVTNPCTALDFGPICTLSVVPVVATVNPTSSTICNGSIQAISLTNASSSSTATFASGPLSIQIPDVVGPPASSNAVVEAGINHTIPVSLPAGSAITRIDVRINITHTYASDLKIVLKNSTTNQVLNLFYHKSGNQTAGANFTNTIISSAGTTRFSAVAPPFTGTFRGDFELSPGSYGDAGGAGPTAFQPTTTSWNTLWGGVNQGSGNWTLAICDAPEWAGDIGTLTSWDMTITYGVPASGVWTSTPAAPNTMYTDAGATTAYVAGTPVNTIYVKPSANTTYCVTYTTPSPVCVSNPTCVNVNVIQPLGGSTTVASKSVCVGSNTSFNVPVTGGPFTYQWQETRDNGLTWNNISNGGVYSGATTATLTLTGVTRSAPVDMNNFKYRVNVNTGPCAGSFTSNVATLTVFALPTVTISATDLALLPNQTSTITASSNPAPGGSPNWAWTRDGSPISGSTNSVVADIDRLGVYQTSVTDVNGCRNSSNQLLIESEAGEKLWIYPNPTSGQFQIRLYYPAVTSEKRRIQIFNSAGAEVMSRDILLSNVTSPHYQRFDVDLSFQPAGVYLVKVIDLYTKKAISGFVIKQAK